MAAALGLLFLEAGVFTTAARGQLNWDFVPREREIPERQQIEDDMTRSRVRLGPVRVLPGFAFTNAGYDSNVFATPTNPFGDWSFTLNAGARFLLPFGTKVYFRAAAVPSYTWYDKLNDRSGFGGAFEVALIGFFNHMKVQLQGIGNQGFVLYSSELNSRVLTRDVGGFGRVELDLARRFSFLASGAIERVRYSQPEGPPDQQVQVLINNRTDSAAKGGLRYQIAPDWTTDVQVEATWSIFEFAPGSRDNRSTGYLASVHYDRPRFYVNLTGGYRQGRATNESTFPEYSIGVGAFYVSYFPISWLEVQGYGRRGISYSVSLADPYYIENQIGGGINVKLIPRVTLRGFGHVGPNQYPLPQNVNGEEVFRRDQVRAYGGGFLIPLWSQAVVTGLATRNITDSNIPGASLAYTRYTVGLNFGAEYSR